MRPQAHDYYSLTPPRLHSAAQCQQRCEEDADCGGWTYFPEASRSSGRAVQGVGGPMQPRSEKRLPGGSGIIRSMQPRELCGQHEIGAASLRRGVAAV